ncbi:MAG TPA: VWA domain-containing protein [Chthoniobacteraceae bacterium]|nr:VWA domain-containing protein [Chthoniobacteraceae bacterium]
MKFALPYLLIGAAVIPCVVLLLHRWSERRARVQLQRIVAPRLRENLLRSVDFAKRWRKTLLFAFGLAALLIALARPLLGFLPMEVERSSVDFFIALDLSRSMLAEDADGKARLVAAKGGLDRMLSRLGADRVGVIAFAGEAFIAAPVTQDHEAVRRNLAALDPTAIARPGSDLAAAIKLAQKTFENGSYESKALVLITDGEELQGDAVIAAREAGMKGMSIFTVGVGSAIGARIPAKKEGGLKFQKNEFGREVLSRLNERALQQIAASGRGFYEALGEDGDGLVAVWNRGLQPLGKGTKTKPSKDMREYFQWPLAVALSLLLGEMLVSDRRKRLQPNRP